MLTITTETDLRKLRCMPKNDKKQMYFYSFDLDLFVFFDKESNCYVCYSPSLDLCSYTDNKESVLSEFESTAQDYFEFCNKQNTLKEDLKQHGWKISFSNIVPPSAEYLSKNQSLQEIKSKDFIKEIFTLDMLTYKE